MMPQQFLRTSYLLTMRHKPVTNITKSHTPCSWMLLLLAAQALTFTVLALPPVASPECPWAPDWKEMQSHSQDRTWMFCNPPFHRKLRTWFLSNVILCTSLLQELHTVLIYRAKPYLFLFMQCHKFTFNGSSIFRCPNDGAFPLLWTSFTFPLCFPCRFSF